MLSFSLSVMLLIAVTLPTLCIWLYFLLYLLISFKGSPKLEHRSGFYKYNKLPKVSVILAARNEEKHIAECFENLLKQDYPNFEIVSVDDSSSDSTRKIMETYLLKNSDKMAVINAGSPPEEWTGKNWACYQGYLNASGEIFLFTDADTAFSSCTISVAVGHLCKDRLDALTARPNIKCESLWGKIVFPVLWTFSHIKYSALRINDNNVESMGYFFGCFYLITRKTYETIGTHREVKNEIIEDAALGNKVKQRGFKMKMYRGEHHIDTMLTGDFPTIIQGLKRSLNLIPFSNNDAISTILTWLLLVNPILLLFSWLLMGQHSIPAEYNLLNQLLIVIDSITILIMVSTLAIQSKVSLSQNLVYGFVSPVAGLLISIVFAFLIAKRKKTGSCNIEWRGRQYIVTRNTYTDYRLGKRD
jgi:chlorobactene glucosyltransferase